MKIRSISLMLLILLPGVLTGQVIAEETTVNLVPTVVVETPKTEPVRIIPEIITPEATEPVPSAEIPAAAVPPTEAPTVTVPPTEAPTVTVPPTEIPTLPASPTPTPNHPAAAPAAAEPAHPEVRTLSAPEIDPQKLLQTGDETYFLRQGFTQDYSETQGVLNEILDNGIIHEYYVSDGKANDLLISMLPAVESVRTSNIRLNLKDGNALDFHAQFTMQRMENLPERAGGRCWIRCGNFFTKAKGSDKGVLLVPGDKAYYYAPVNGETVYEPIADLSVLNQNNPINFDFIRLDGVFYAYGNGEFLFAVEDGIVGRVAFEAGSELFAGGNLVRCEFDDFSMVYR